MNTAGHKRRAFEECLGVGLVAIQIDASVPGVCLPADLSGVVVLNYSHRFRVPIDSNERGVHAHLSFNGEGHATFAPWSAVFSIASRETGAVHVWPHSNPVVSALASGPTPAPKSRPRLQVVK